MTTGNGIPFLDLITPHIELEEKLMGAINGVLKSGGFIGGPVVEDFERRFAEYCEAKYCVGVSSGTDALRFALIAADIGAGDIVITVPNTFAATVEAIIQAGATTQFVDVDPETYNMSIEALRHYLRTHCEKKAGMPTVHRTSGKKVKAIMPVHLYGQMCDMDEIMAIAEEYGLLVFEDACQAHGAQYYSKKEKRWRTAGSIGKAAGFSFYPGKNLGACGEAGAVTTNDEQLALRIKMIRDHGQNKKYHHLVEGYNGRLDAMQAAILRVKLDYMNEWTQKRKDAAAKYNKDLKSVEGVVVPAERDWSRAVYHLYVIRVKNRDEMQKFMTDKKIGTGLHYPIPLHLQKAYAHLANGLGEFPVAERLAGEILSIPMFPQLQGSQQDEVVESLRQFLGMQTVGVGSSSERSR